MGKKKSLLGNTTPGYDNLGTEIESIENINRQNAEEDINSMMQNIEEGNKPFAGNLNIQGNEDYDNSMDFTRASEGPNYVQNYRANTQDVSEKYGRALKKMSGLAATTMIDNTIGLAAGLVEVASTGDFNKLYDNDVSRALKNFNDSMEESNKLYASTEEQAKPWYKNLNSANFWGDNVIKNFGYVLGQVVPGTIIGGGVSKILQIGKLAKYSKLLSLAQAEGKTFGTLKGVELASELSKTAKTLKLRNLTSSSIASVISSKSEAGLESMEWKDNFIADRLQEYVATNRLESFSQIPQNEINKIYKLAEEGQNDVFVMNTAVISASTFLQFGKMLGGGYSTARKTLSNISRNGSGAYTFSKQIPKTIGKSLKTSFGESEEEGLQYTIQQGANSYYSRLYNGKSERDVSQYAKDMAKAYGESYTTEEGQVSRFTGALIGMIGAPGIGGKVGVNWGGGITEGIQDVRKERRKAKELTDKLNTYYNNKEENPVAPLFRNAIASTTSAKVKDVATATGDQFVYKNEEAIEFTNAVIAHNDAGRFNDMIETIQLMGNTTDAEGARKMLGDVKYETMSDSEVLNKLHDTSNELVKKAKEIKESNNTIIERFPNISEEGEKLLTYQMALAKDVDTRIEDLSNELNIESSVQINDKEGNIIPNLSSPINLQKYFSNKENRNDLVNKTNENIKLQPENIGIADKVKDFFRLLDRREEFASEISKNTNPEYIHSGAFDEATQELKTNAELKAEKDKDNLHKKDIFNSETVTKIGDNGDKKQYKVTKSKDGKTVKIQEMLPDGSLSNDNVDVSHVDENKLLNYISDNNTTQPQVETSPVITEEDAPPLTNKETKDLNDLEAKQEQSDKINDKKAKKADIEKRRKDESETTIDSILNKGSLKKTPLIKENKNKIAKEFEEAGGMDRVVSNIFDAVSEKSKVEGKKTNDLLKQYLKKVHPDKFQNKNKKEIGGIFSTAMIMVSKKGNVEKLKELYNKYININAKYDAELSELSAVQESVKPSESNKSVTNEKADIEAKKADIEKRRKNSISNKIQSILDKHNLSFLFNKVLNFGDIKNARSLTKATGAQFDLLFERVSLSNVFRLEQLVHELIHAKVRLGLRETLGEDGAYKKELEFEKKARKLRDIIYKFIQRKEYVKDDSPIGKSLKVVQEGLYLPELTFLLDNLTGPTGLTSYDEFATYYLTQEKLRDSVSKLPIGVQNQILKFIKDTTGFSQVEMDSIIALDEKTEDSLDEINAKYDAELAALEKKDIPEVDETNIKLNKEYEDKIEAYEKKIEKANKKKEEKKKEDTKNPNDKNDDLGNLEDRPSNHNNIVTEDDIKEYSMKRNIARWFSGLTGIHFDKETETLSKNPWMQRYYRFTEIHDARNYKLTIFHGDNSAFEYDKEHKTKNVIVAVVTDDKGRYVTMKDTSNPNELGTTTDLNSPNLIYTNMRKPEDGLSEAELEAEFNNALGKSSSSIKTEEDLKQLRDDFFTRRDAQLKLINEINKGLSKGHKVTLNIDDQSNGIFNNEDYKEKNNINEAIPNNRIIVKFNPEIDTDVNPTLDSEDYSPQYIQDLDTGKVYEGKTRRLDESEADMLIEALKNSSRDGSGKTTMYTNINGKKVKFDSIVETISLGSKIKSDMKPNEETGELEPVAALPNNKNTREGSNGDYHLSNPLDVTALKEALLYDEYIGKKDPKVLTRSIRRDRMESSNSFNQIILNEDGKLKIKKWKNYKDFITNANNPGLTTDKPIGIQPATKPVWKSSYIIIGDKLEVENNKSNTEATEVIIPDVNEVEVSGDIEQHTDIANEVEVKHKKVDAVTVKEGVKGFKNFINKQQLPTEQDIEQLIASGEITYTDEEGNICAKLGGRNSKFTKGGRWKIIKEFKGASHERGGIDITIGNGKISMKGKQGKIEAKHGLIINKNTLK